MSAYDTMLISVVVPTYNRLYSLKSILLPSLNGQTYANFEVIIVDDGSTDGSQEYFKGKDYCVEFKFLANKIRYYRNSINVGAPASRNRAADLAKGKWVYIVEDDVMIEDTEMLKKAVEIISSLDDSVAVLSPKREERLGRGYYANPPKELARIGVISGEIYFDPSQEYSGYVQTTHASSFVRTDLYRKFRQDEVLFFGNTFRDESDLYYRIMKEGYRIYYCGDRLKTVHRNDFATQGGQKKVNTSSLFRQELMVWTNHFQYLRKNYSIPYVRIAFFILVRTVKNGGMIIGCGSVKSLLSRLRI